MAVGMWRRAVAVAPVLAIAFAVSAGATAAAQEPTTGPFSMEITLGMGGFVDPAAALPVAIEIAAEELLVGRVLVTSGAVDTEVNVEVPADSLKRYGVEASPPGSRRNVTVVLFRDLPDGTEERVAAETVRVQVPRNELLVGLIGVEEIQTVLRSAVTAPLQREVTPLVLSAEDLELGPGVLEYLVVGSEGLGSLSQDSRDRIARWVSRGGRLYGPSSAVSEVADPASGVAWPGTSAVVARVGDGEVAAIDPLSATVEDWSALLRGGSPPGLIRQEAFNAQPLGLVAAASAGREAGVPALPWLLGGIVLFVVLVGPVNFLLLRRVGRPEAAWATVPLLSAVFVAGFWLVGRAQLQDFTITQAAVIIEDTQGTQAFAGFLLQVESAGDHELVFPEGWSARASAAGGVSGRRIDDVDGRSGIGFELEDLGIGTAQAEWSRTTSVGVDVTVTSSGNGSEATVANNSTAGFWGWGMVVNGLGFVGSESLAMGETDAVAIRAAGFGNVYEPVIAEAMNRRRFAIDGFDSNEFGVVNSLAGYAETQLTNLRTSGVYFFGFTDELTAPVTVDGRDIQAEGPTLVIRELQLDDNSSLALGSVRAELLDVIGASSVEGFFDEIYAYGADEVYFGYEVPEGAPQQASINAGRFTRLERAEAYRWDTASFETILWGDAFDLAPYVSPGGDMVVKASTEQDFFDDVIQLSQFRLTWSNA